MMFVVIKINFIGGSKTGSNWESKSCPTDHLLLL